VRRYLARMSPIGPNPERSGIMYNLNGWNIGYEVLCAGKRRGVGISQGLSHEGLRCAASAICFSRRRAAARKASSSLRASSIRWGGMSVMTPNRTSVPMFPTNPRPVRRV